MAERGSHAQKPGNRDSPGRALRQDRGSREKTAENKLLLAALEEDIEAAKASPMTNEEGLAYLDQASTQMRAGDYRGALQNLAPALRHCPTNAQAFLLTARAHRDLGELERSRHVCDAGLKHNPNHADLMICRATIADREKKHQDALIFWKAVCESHPWHHAGYCGAAQASAVLGKIDESDAWCEAGIKIGAKEPWLLIQWGNNAMQRRDYLGALRRWTKVRKLLPANMEALRKIAYCYWGLGNRKKALAFAKKALQKAPGIPEAMLTHAEILARLGKNEESARGFDAALEKSPDYPRTWTGAINGAIIAGDFSRAQSLCGAALQKFPQNAELSRLDIEITDRNMATPGTQACLKIVDKICGQDRNFISRPETARVSLNAINHLAGAAPQFAALHSALIRKLATAHPVQGTKRAPRIAFIVSQATMLGYYAPIIRCIPPGKIDVCLHERGAPAELYARCGLAGYRIFHDAARLKDYDCLVGEDTFRLLPDSSKIHIGIDHSQTHNMQAHYEKLDLVIYIAERTCLYKTTRLLEGEGKLLAGMDRSAKCELAWTGLHEIVKEREAEPAVLRASLRTSAGLAADAADKIILCLEDWRSSADELIACLNRLSESCLVALKIHPSASPEEFHRRLSARVLMVDSALMGASDLRRAADFIMAGITSGSFLSSVMRGQKVLPYYSRLLKPKYIYTAGIPLWWQLWIGDAPRTQLGDGTDAYNEALKYFHDADRLFDLRDHGRLSEAITGTDYSQWYAQNLPEMRKRFFGRFIARNAAVRTAEYIQRFAAEGTLGADCAAVHFKKACFK